MSPIDFPWDADNIHDLAMRVNQSANRLIDETSMAMDGDEERKLPTITYEEAVATVALAVSQIHSTINNSYTAMAMGLMPEEQE